jgi:ferritin-like metal-binding protein YciE
MTLEEQNPMMNTKLLQYLNEMLSTENAAVERLESRIQQTTLDDVKRQLQQHLQETREQQQRLINLIKNRGIGTTISPTSAKADLPVLNPKTETTSRVDEMISKPKDKSESTEVRDQEKLKSIVNETENVMMKAEKEFQEAKQDGIIENAEIITYKTLMEVAKKVGANDALPILEQSLQEEESMAKWIMTNLPELLDKLWPYIESSAGNRPVNA